MENFHAHGMKQVLYLFLKKKMIYLIVTIIEVFSLINNGIKLILFPEKHRNNRIKNCVEVLNTISFHKIPIRWYSN